MEQLLNIVHSVERIPSIWIWIFMNFTKEVLFIKEDSFVSIFHIFFYVLGQQVEIDLH